MTATIKRRLVSVTVVADSRTPSLFLVAEPMTSIGVACALALTVASGVLAQPADPRRDSAAALTAGQKAARDGEQEKPAIEFTAKEHPSLRVGKLLRVDFLVKMQGDFRGFSPKLASDEGLFDMNRRRAGVEGVFLRHFEYEVERELRKETPWRDVFLNVRYFNNVQVRMGKFKLPFSLDQLTSLTRLDFVYRSRIADNLSPARDVGVAAHGRFGARRISYEAGIFRHDGENARLGHNSGAGRTVAGRLTIQPLRLPAGRTALGELELGVGGTTGEVAEGLYALRGRTAFREPFFSPVYLNGRRVRFGLDADWNPGPFSLRGEFLRVSDARRGQGLLGENLPSLISRGWYISGSWAVTGEPKAGGIEPRRPLCQGGAGAIEVAARHERIRFGSFSADEPPSRSPRAANLLATSDHAWTFGVTWYVNRWTRVQVNAIREWIEDTDRSPLPGRDTFWSRVARLQFVL